MVKRCSWGTCNSDTRYPERIINVSFLPFPKPKTNYDACLRWIKACGRPVEQLNVNKITRDTYVCSKHFVGGFPSEKNPDPFPATGGQIYEARVKSRKRKYVELEHNSAEPSCIVPEVPCIDHVNPIIMSRNENDKDTQTDEIVYTNLDFVAHNLSIKNLEEEKNALIKQNEDLKMQLASCVEQDFKLKSKRSPAKKHKQVVNNKKFSAETVANSNIKKLFEYYTGLTYVRFILLVNFLFPEEGINPVNYKEKRKEVKAMLLTDQLFLVLCRLRNGLHIKDLAYRFNIKPQSVSVIFKSVIHYMYLKLGYLSYWPHRDTIIQNMPQQYKQEFPTCLAIIDCTELKTEKPSSLKSQSQCYSDYKSSTTLKSLVVTDPRGSVIFVSDLFSGSISDNEICKESGFYKLLQQLKDQGYLQDNDGIMADKGFRIEKDLGELNLRLNIPPFASTATQMSSGDVALTRKIAAHRIHIERSINQIKNFKIVNRRIPGTLFYNINEIWTVCSLLTNFQDTLVKM